MKQILMACILAFPGIGLKAQSPELGQWRGIIEYQDEAVPFEFKVEREADQLIITIENGEETIKIENSTIEGDSIIIPLKPFDAWLKAKVDQHQMEGFWRKGYRTRGIPFKAQYGAPRFERGTKKGLKKVSGNWKLEIEPPSGLTYPAVGMLTSKDGLVTGTFLTEVSDLRYFEGVLFNDSIFMSSFDGAHAFLFKGTFDQNKISGELVLDNKYSEAVSGVKSETASIPIAFKEVPSGNRPFYNILSAGDPEVKIEEDDYFNKVLVLQLFGTWCPNSMDQTLFLRDWYATKPEAVDILAVTFEPNFSTTYGNKRISDYKSSMDLPYRVSLGGELSKGQAALALPHIEKINAFPTLILVDKQGFIRYEFSYFNGPATGQYHSAFIEKFEECIVELSSE
ncbi:MAG: hypothetical protein AAF519_13005 [Bacteroidota bacterium]